MAAEAPNPRITLYWLEKSRSQRVIWLLEECKVQYEVKTFKRGKDMLAPKELKEVHPLGKSPVLGITFPDQEKPTVLAESGLIFEYLIAHFAPHLEPKKWKDGQENKLGGETESWLRYRYLIHYAEGTLMPFMVLFLITQTIRKAKVPFFIKPITNQVAKQIESFVLPNIQNNLQLLEDLLNNVPGGGKFICGPELSGADIMLSFPLVALNQLPTFDAKKYPKLTEYAATIEKEPGYVSGVKKVEDLTGEKFSAKL